MRYRVVVEADSENDAREAAIEEAIEGPDIAWSYDSTTDVDTFDCVKQQEYRT
jgi:hypothetical protein